MAAFAWNESIYELPRGVGLAVCVAHHGEHVYEAGCRALPARRQPFSAPLRRCAEIGCSFAAEAPHNHLPAAEPVRVEIDAEALAVGIATALDGLMQRRREARQAEPGPTPHEAPVPHGFEPVTVWADDGAG